MSDLARTSGQLGNIIRRARKRLELSQGELAARAGLRQATISQIENGSAATRLETLLRVLGALDLDIHVAARAKDDPAAFEDLF